jgi:hypothetical protein
MSEELSALTATEYANNTCRYAATEAEVPLLVTHYLVTFGRPRRDRLDQTEN